MRCLLSLVVMLEIGILRVLLGHARLPNLTTSHLVNILLTVVSLERSLRLVTLGGHRVDHVGLMDLVLLILR
jgi:hypothetical protein